ncbi:MAG: hypothetical protein JW705_08070 [Methanosarcinaceae archaeon]|nr:hypothetical protein [Methanosarcinaceae archaeon]
MPYRKDSIRSNMPRTSVTDCGVDHKRPKCQGQAGVPDDLKVTVAATCEGGVVCDGKLLTSQDPCIFHLFWKEMVSSSGEK